MKGKERAQTKPTTMSELPGPYIVEQKSKTPVLTVLMPEVTDLYTNLYNNTIIYRFNGFWLKSDVLHQCIFDAWSPKCEIYLCPKGFFIVRFNTVQEWEHILNKGPWFSGNVGLFMTPWFPKFDANTMVVSKMPVWLRLHNLPLHFWHHNVLIAIGNSPGRFLKIDEDRLTRGIFTFAKICVEVDLSQELLDSIALNFKST